MKLDLEYVLKTLLNTVRRKKKAEEDKKRIVRVEDEEDISQFEGFTEGIVDWIFRIISDLTVAVLEKLFDFVMVAILKLVDVGQNALEWFTNEIKVQAAALDALVEYLTKYLGFAIEY
ncbi:uncharacterized protein LOC108097448 [Drosophila ficusphila]|uniref:uncharacterized protein LOC108097448 n=1 Tax=Drosophila ficusphila TaxID=30025 RepID=UPI0007E6F373|nr:uncharacterized protein LOC108097448 [Drosophila ficusphila]